MSRHTGFASLPLHGGKAPAWLFGRMVRLSREIIIYLVSETARRSDKILKVVESIVVAKLARIFHNLMAS